MRILITGGAGFVGQYLAAALTASHDVVCLDNLSPQVHRDVNAAAQRFPGEVIVGDVSDPGAWEPLPRCDIVIHLAAETGTGQSMYESERYHRVNVEGTGLAAETAARWGVPLISMSSRAVYGEGRYECSEHSTRFGGRCCPRAEPAASREMDPHHPVSVYGETKSEGEALLTSYAGDIAITVIRPQNVVGFGQALHNPYTGVLAAFLARLREGRAFSVYGDGTATRDFVHVEDLARLLAWCVEHPGATGHVRVFNCGTGERTSLTQLARYATAASPDGGAGIEYVDVHRAGDIDHAAADLELLREAGAPMPLLTAEQAVADFISRSWNEPGASSTTWDDALSELAEKGLTD